MNLCPYCLVLVGPRNRLERDLLRQKLLVSQSIQTKKINKCKLKVQQKQHFLVMFSLFWVIPSIIAVLYTVEKFSLYTHKTRRELGFVWGKNIFFKDNLPNLNII